MLHGCGTSVNALRQQGCPFFFFFNDTATTEIYTLSLHDALPIYRDLAEGERRLQRQHHAAVVVRQPHPRDRKSTRLNSSHSQISYAVFCLKKKKKSKDHYEYDDKDTASRQPSSDHRAPRHRSTAP